jgi:hypothetical protein
MGTSVLISDIRESREFKASGIEFIRVEDCPAEISHLVIPLKNKENAVLGVLQLTDREKGKNRPVLFDENLKRMMESYSSLAVAALDAYLREQQLKLEIQKLRIEVDESKREKQVREITKSDSFQQLQMRAEEMRLRRIQRLSSK